MRVLLVTDWNRGRGGAEAYAMWLRDGLRAAGDDVSLLTSTAGTAAEGTAEFVAFGSNRLAAQSFLQIFNPFAATAIRRAVRQFHPDIACVNMFAHHLSPAIFGALGSTPVVLIVSDYKCVCPIGSKLMPDGSLCQVQAGWVCCRAGCLSFPHWLRDRVRYSYLHSAVRGVRRVLVCSRWVQQELAAADIQSEVIPWPVPPHSLTFLRSPSEHPEFVFCGRLDVEKGVALLLRAFARVRQENPSARLNASSGRGPERTKLEKLAATLHLGESVVFLGWLAPPDIEHHLCEAWCSVAPSLWAEPFGLVAVEGIVRGIPVIASADGGLSEIVEHGISGLLFPNNDEGALAECLLSIAREHAFPTHTLPDDVIQRAVNTFSVARHVQRLRQIFAGIAKTDKLTVT